MASSCFCCNSTVSSALSTAATAARYHLVPCYQAVSPVPPLVNASPGPRPPAPNCQGAPGRVLLRHCKAQQLLLPHYSLAPCYPAVSPAPPLVSASPAPPTGTQLSGSPRKGPAPPLHSTAAGPAYQQLRLVRGVRQRWSGGGEVESEVRDGSRPSP